MGGRIEENDRDLAPLRLEIGFPESNGPREDVSITDALWPEGLQIGGGCFQEYRLWHHEIYQKAEDDDGNGKLTWE